MATNEKPAPKLPKFKVGDQVVLKSGGPVMTIEEAKVTYSSKQFTGEYSCQWFAGKKLSRGSFPEEALAPSLPKSVTQTQTP
ncbi:DUF2158 domain-containing protein [Serratia fonticola]|uniref:YodC family protein n=1 Tax=Serratia fonticola TaxID=47917 RepID=UPI003AABE91A